MDDEKVMLALVGGGFALAGVICTWLLQEFSTAVKERRLAKHELGPVAAELFRIHRESIALRALLARPRDYTDVSTSRAFDRSFLYLHQHERLSAALEDARKHVAARNPVAATQLDVVREMVQELSKICADENNHEEWMRQFALVLRGFQDQDKELARVVLMVARMHGPLTWCRVWRELRRQRRSLLEQKAQPTQKTAVPGP